MASEMGLQEVIEDSEEEKKRVEDHAREFLISKFAKHLDEKKVQYQAEIVRFATDNDSIGSVVCKRAEQLNASAIVLAKHNKGAVKVTQLYRERIPPGSSVLDLCSSWVSHLPDEVSYARVVGHGMNAAELARNPRLDTFFVRNLNTEPRGWAADDNSFDAVLCCVSAVAGRCPVCSVQYLQQPEEVFSEVHRVLKPGGVCIVTFSNRMFPHKAISAWTQADSGYARCQVGLVSGSPARGESGGVAVREIS
ncbi:methyltransf_11 domain-containing protein [Haematococcus lacustris]|uniref:Methyltransf_11 domain-containing protein n=1 Tax=Haematococcus lacustris TaxID=44745 RepID=A0A699YHC4_HAELA|nr:methyltransf_11 domain-containing protein [Haematococcus lacustris]